MGDAGHPLQRCLTQEIRVTVPGKLLRRLREHSTYRTAGRTGVFPDWKAVSQAHTLQE